jgi:EpsI family protein
LYALLLVAGFYLQARPEPGVPLNRPFSRFPNRVAQWRQVGEDRLDAETLAVLRPTDYLSRTYTDESGNRVTLYLGYHGGGEGSGEVHSPRHCLPGTGWQPVSSRTRKLDPGGQDINAMVAVYGKEDIREVFLYWFEVPGGSTPDEFRLKCEQLFNTLLHNRKDVLFVRISVPARKGVESAEETAARFAREFAPVIRDFLPRSEGEEGIRGG